MQLPTLAGIYEARTAIAPHLDVTPLRRYAAVDRLVGTEVWIKHENHQPTGAFKVRGGINLIGRLSDEERDRGVIAASTGNHGQSVAYAANLFSVPAIVCVPEEANPVKVQSMQDLGAEVIFHGKDFDDAREHCEEIAAAKGYRYIHSGDEPLLIEGVGTYALEMMVAQPDLETILVPIGGGSGAAGVCVASEGFDHRVEIIGVQSEAAPAAYKSWKGKELVTDEMGTFAEGLATRSAFELPQKILWGRLDDFILVTEEELRRSIMWILELTRNLAEGAGAAALAGAVKLGERLAGRKVGIICSGGNISPDQLRDVLSQGEPIVSTIGQNKRGTIDRR